MALGKLTGIVGVGSTQTYEYREFGEFDVAPNSSGEGEYEITYEYWTYFAGQNAYRVYVNGQLLLPDAGFQLNSANWVLSNPNVPYDCINGACRPSSEYNTPGLYPSLSACEVACGTGCSGKCISNKDWLTIQSLASHLKHKNCS